MCLVTRDINTLSKYGSVRAKHLTCWFGRTKQSPFKGVVRLAGLFLPLPNLLRDSFRIRVRPSSDRGRGSDESGPPAARVCQQPSLLVLVLVRPSSAAVLPISQLCLPLTQFRPTLDRSVIFRPLPALRDLTQVDMAGMENWKSKHGGCWAIYIVHPIYAAWQNQTTLLNYFFFSLIIP